MMMYDGAWGLHWIGILLFWIIPIVLIAFFVAAFRQWPRDQRVPDKETPLEILEKRYARGEINDKEFGNMKRMLLHT